MREIYKKFEEVRFPLNELDWIYKVEFDDGTIMTELDTDGKPLYTQSDINNSNSPIVQFGYFNNSYDLHFNNNGLLHDICYKMPNEIVYEFAIKDVKSNKIYPLVDKCVLDNIGLKRSTPLNPHFFQNKLFAFKIDDEDIPLRTSAYKFGFSTSVKLDNGETMNAILNIILSNSDPDIFNSLVIDHTYNSNDILLKLNAVFTEPKALVYLDVPKQYRDTMKLKMAKYKIGILRTIDDKRDPLSDMNLDLKPMKN